MTTRTSRLLAVVCLVSLVLPTVAWGSPFDRARDSLRGLFKRDSGTAGALSTDEIGAGLREALKVATERVVGQLGKTDGFNADPTIHIPLPDTLSKAQSALRAVGASGLADELELRLNRAAEAATPKAKEIFWNAIGEMTLEDVDKIWKGPDDAATQYFREKMTPPLKEAMRPVVDESLAEAGAVQAYDRMMGRYSALPFAPDVKADLTDYALDKTLGGMFHYVAKEEAAIRQDPAKRTTELLQKVFGANK